MSALDRELIKWIQSMDLSHPLKNPRRDLGNGFLVAEILSRYDRNVEMHSFDTGSAMSRRLDNWQQIRKLLSNRNCTTVTEEMMDSAIQMRGEGASNVLEALYEHLTKKRLQAGKITAQKKEAEAANEDLKAKAVLDTPAFMRPTAAALLRENNDETVNRLQRLTGRTNEDHINKKNEELLVRHGQIMQAAKEASPERYEPKKPNASTLKGLMSPNGTIGGPRPAWGENTQNGTDGGASSRARQKLVVAKHLDVRVVDESVLATFAAREQQAKEEALKNGFDTRESLPVALSRVVYRILQSYGIVEAVDEGYDDIYGEGRSDVSNRHFHVESEGLGMLIDSRASTSASGGEGVEGDGGVSRRDSTNTQTPSVAAGENEDVAGTGDYFTKFIVLRERIPMEIKTYVWNSLVTATEIGASPPQSAPTNEEQQTSPLRERGSSSKAPVGIVARNTARLIADRPSEFQHLAVLFTFALGREAAQIALPPSLYGANNVQDFSNNADNRNSEQAASFATDCQFVYRFLETVGQSLGDKSSMDNAPTSRSNNGLSADTADYATKLLIPQLLASYLLPQGTSFILEWCSRLILAYTPVRHASEIRTVLDSLRRSLTSAPTTITSTSTNIDNNNSKDTTTTVASSVGVLNDRFYVVAMTFLSQVLFDAVASPSGSGGNASLLYSALCDVNISVAKEALLGTPTTATSKSTTATYKSTPTPASKAAGLHLLRRTMLPYDVMTYHQSFTPSLINPDVLNNQTSTIGPLPTSTLTTAAVNRFRNMGDAGARGGGSNNNSNGSGVTVEGVPAMADQLLAVAASLALRGPTNGMRGQGSGLSPTILQQVFALDEVASTPTASALRTVTSMLAQQLPRFLLLESAFRAPKHLGASGTHQLLHNEILEPFHHYMASHSHDRTTAKSDLLAKKFEKLREALIEQRRFQIEEHSQGESTLGVDEIREMFLLTNEDLLEVARSEMDPETIELAAIDNNNNNDDGRDNNNNGEEEGEEDHAVLMHRFFTGGGCWLGKVLIAAAQDDSNWEVRLAALEAASVLKYSSERFVVEAQLSPDVDAALGELVAAEEASLELGDAESPLVVEKRLALEKTEQRLSSAANFLETVVGRAQESAFIYFANKSPALRRMSMVTVAPFLLKPPPQSTTIDEDGNLVGMHLDNSTSIMASLFVQRIVEELRDSVSASVTIAATHMQDQRNKRPTTSNNVSELMQHLTSKNAASMRLKALVPPASVACTFPFDLQWSGENDDTQTATNSPRSSRVTEPVVVVGGKVVSSVVCSSVLQFVDPLVLASCVVTHLGHGQAELRALEEHVQEEQQYQQATLGGAEGVRTADDAAADISAFVAQHTSPVCSTFEVSWLLESIFSRAVHLSGVSAQLSGLISAAAASIAAASATLDDDEGDAKSVISTTSTSAAARLALRQRNKAAGSPQALSISASINNNPTHQRYQAFLEAVDSSTRQGWLRVLAEVKYHLLDSVSDPENIQQSTSNEPMMNAIDEVGAALQHQFQRDRVEAQHRAKEGSGGSEATTPTLETQQQQQLQVPPPDAGDIFAREVQQRCFHVLTKVYRDLKNVHVGQGKGFEGGSANPQDDAQVAAERDAAVDWLVTML